MSNTTIGKLLSKLEASNTKEEVIFTKNQEDLWNALQTSEFENFKNKHLDDYIEGEIDSSEAKKYLEKVQGLDGINLSSLLRVFASADTKEFLDNLDDYIVGDSDSKTSELKKEFLDAFERVL